MKHLLNTLFVTSEDIYLSLDGENVVANRERQEIARYPLHTLDGIISFSYPGASPRSDGRLRKAGYLSGVLYPPRPFFGPCYRGKLWERIASPYSVPNCR